MIENLIRQCQDRPSHFDANSIAETERSHSYDAYGLDPQEFTLWIDEALQRPDNENLQHICQELANRARQRCAEMEIDQKLTFLAALVKQSAYNFDETYRNSHGVYYEFVMKASKNKNVNCKDCIDAQIIRNTGQAKALEFKTACRN